MKWLNSFFSSKEEINLTDKFDIFYYLEKENIFELENFLQNNKLNLYLDSLCNTAFHFLCYKAKDPEFFKEAWKLLVKEGLCYLKYNKALELPLHKLIINNPNFYSSGVLKEVIHFLYPRYYDLEHFPYPYNTHEYYFFKEYNYIHQERNGLSISHPVALYKFKKEWNKEQIPNVHIYKEYKPYFQAQTIEELTFLITKRKSKSFKKLVENYWWKADYRNIKLIKFISHLKLPDYIILDVLNAILPNNENKFGKNCYSVFSHSHAVDWEPYLELYNWAIDKMSPRKFVSLFIEQPFFNEDTICLLQQMEELEIPVKFKSFKSTKHLHDYCAVKVRDETLNRQKKEIEKIEASFKFRQSFFAELLNKQTNLAVIVPLSPEELVVGGKELKICVGSLHYMHQVARGQVYIFFIIKNNQYYACCSVQANTLEIKELRAQRNQNVDDETFNLIKEKLNYFKIDKKD